MKGFHFFGFLMEKRIIALKLVAYIPLNFFFPINLPLKYPSQVRSLKRSKTRYDRCRNYCISLSSYGYVNLYFTTNKFVFALFS